MAVEEVAVGAAGRCHCGDEEGGEQRQQQREGPTTMREKNHLICFVLVGLSPQYTHATILFSIQPIAASPFYSFLFLRRRACI